MSKYVANHERVNELYRKCQYPNLAAEIYSHTAHPDYFSERAGITTELLMAFLEGKEELTTAELLGLYEALRPTEHFYPSVKESMKYVFSPRLSVYDMSNRKHRNKIHAMRLKLEAVKLIEGTMYCEDKKDAKEIALTFCDERQGKYICRAAISTALRAIDSIELSNAAERYRRGKKERRGIPKTA